MNSYSLEKAYEHCQNVARSHYENFPVASKLLPAKLRKPIAVIYAFARKADDYADEGNLETTQRQFALNQMGRELQSCLQQPSEDPVFIALADVIQKHELPLQPFEDLITAFCMDTEKNRYASFGEVMEYCRYSANPVGRLLLHLAKAATPKNLGYSDAICSALQLINFLQDIEQDYKEMSRIYLPQDEMQRYGVTEEMIAKRESTPQVRMLVKHQVERANNLLLSGAPLGLALKGRLGLEIRMIILGGSRILKKLNNQPGDVFSRPRLQKTDWLYMLVRSLFPRFKIYSVSRSSKRNH